MTRAQFIKWLYQEYKISTDAAREIWANDELRDSFITEFRKDK